jgi:hypothetical protein
MVEYPLSKVVEARYISDVGAFQILEYLHKFYLLSIPNAKICN